MMRFVIATKNAHKFEEIARILRALGVEAVSEQELGVTLPEVEETGKSFAENALLKAESACRATGLAAIADDSGLCVDALDGAPGLYSARYGGAGATDAQKIEKLLSALAGVETRTARFVSCICCLLPDGERLFCEGSCSGSIADVPRGAGGFGYDPVFLTPDGQSFAQLSAEQKDAVSHRGRALRRLQQELPAFLKEKKA